MATKAKRASGGGETAPAKMLSAVEAIERLKTSRPTFYRWLREGRIRGFKAGRQWRFREDDLDRFVAGKPAEVEVPVRLDPDIAFFEKALAEVGVENARGIARDAAPVDRLVALDLRLAWAQKASDIHMAAHLVDGEPRLTLRHRMDGILHTLRTFSPRLLGALVQAWKRRAGLDLLTEGPQMGRIRLPLGKEEIVARIAVVPDAFGEAVTARLLDVSAGIPTLADIGYRPEDRSTLEAALRQPYGVVVVNGPSGCGKTTTLYSCLLQLAEPGTKVLTVEDPIEVILPWATQIPVNPKRQTTFASAARAALQADPDVVMVGEVREAETLRLILLTALTGHLVLTALHAEDSAKALVRMVEMGMEPWVVGDAVRLVTSQRLVRKLCPDCRRKAPPPAGALDRARAILGGPAAAALDEGRWHEPVGCPRCRKTGYLGRMILAEMMEVREPVATALREGAPVAEVRLRARAQGMTPMAADGVLKAARGLTTLDEVFRTFGVPAGVEA